MLLSFYSLKNLFYSDNFYKIMLHICSQETAFCCFYGQNAEVSFMFKFHSLMKLNVAHQGLSLAFYVTTIKTANN